VNELWGSEKSPPQPVRPWEETTALYQIRNFDRKIPDCPSPERCKKKGLLREAKTDF